MISRKEHGRLDEKYGLERRREIGTNYHSVYEKPGGTLY
ncbi:hypothetical protein T4C_304 [Trichinella pseudospiralis]|uniref:Uncharacterized protein n=1 Tax=Trichinella pseudospiralis TaxID=6337 RepID=A0A0V1G8I6_TRIPS|nr:hypothetical protein T4C_304 [Trichinella pseudospiralis]